MKKTYIKGEIYHFTFSNSNYEYVEGYKINGKYPSIYRDRRDKGSGWSYAGVYSRYCCSICPTGLSRVATNEEKQELVKIMKNNNFIIKLKSSLSYLFY